MVFLLSTQNVLHYLAKQGILKEGEQDVGHIESKACKNFNLLVHSSNNRHFLVKQEPHDREGITNRDFLNEWQIYELVRNYPELGHIRLLLPEAIHFDAKYSILIFNYLTDYIDLGEFYAQRQIFPAAIAASLGTALSAIHRATLDRQDYKEFLVKQEQDNGETEHDVDLSYEPEALTPKSFGELSADGLKFYELYQRYESLGHAICELSTASEPCCLIHNDLKLNNVLLHLNWQVLLSLAESCSLSAKPIENPHPVRLIDWEKWTWGDPAADLGTLIASYLKIWLKSLTIQAGFELDVALRLAGTPLETVQPSIVALVQSYLVNFSEILERSPGFLQRVIQFAGLALIESIQAKLHYHEPFGNTEICMLQVAKALLCTPLQSIEAVFGVTVDELLKHQPIPDAWYPPSVSSEICQQPVKATQTQAVIQTGSIATPPIRSTPELTLDAILQDLVVNIQIQADFRIYHPHYAPSEHPAGLGDRLHHLSADIQHHYLKIQLQNYLYDIYFSGEQPLAQAQGVEVNSTALTSEQPSLLENNEVRGLNVEFYEQIHDNNCGNGYFDPNWHVLRHASDSTCIVQKDGLTVQIQPQQHLQSQEFPAIGDIVSIHLPRNRFETGFYVAVGNAGLLPDDASMIELYFNVTPDAAIALMRDLTQYLNALYMPFLFKVVSDPNDYGRYDSGILQVERGQYATVRQVLQQVYDVAPNFQAPVPLFSKMLAPGLGLAEDPADDVSISDFGMHRCQLVADALLSVWQTGNDSGHRMSAIRQRFAQQGLDWQRPYLNPHSEDIYTPLGKSHK